MKALAHRFDNNHSLQVLVGQHSQHLERLEALLGVTIRLRGNELTIKGPRAMEAGQILEKLYTLVEKGKDVTMDDIDAAVRMNGVSPSALHTLDHVRLKTKRGFIEPRSPMQAHYIQAMQNHDLVFGLGPAGTGKTYLAVAYAVSLLISGEVERIILSRPAVEAGEQLGFLPGDLKEKVDPYLRPLYDALRDMIPYEQAQHMIENDAIEVAPLAFMRGRTLSNAIVILDEAQNTKPIQMKMFLTRMGRGAKMIITGDLTQIDLPQGVPSGLREATRILHKTPGISFITFSEKDVVRHDLVSRIIQAYDSSDS